MKKTDIEEDNEKREEQGNYMTTGMGFGLVAGGFGMVILSMFGQIAWGGVSVAIGMMVGMLIGMTIPKKK